MSEGKILFIVEGSKTEPRFFARLGEVFGLRFRIYCLETNIYSLYKRMKEIDFDGDVKDVLGEIHPEKKALLSERFAYTYLIFDCDAHHPKADDRRTQEEIVMDNFARLKEMASYFVDETDPGIGRLYINYPMMESYRDCDSFFDESYADAKAPLESLSSYKRLVSRRKLSKIHSDKLTKDQFASLLLQNLYKLNLIGRGKWAKPDYASYLRDSPARKIAERQEREAKEEKALFVLNSSLFLIADFFGNRDGFYDSLSSDYGQSPLYFR